MKTLTIIMMAFLIGCGGGGGDSPVETAKAVDDPTQPPVIEPTPPEVVPEEPMPTPLPEPEEPIPPSLPKPEPPSAKPKPPIEPEPTPLPDYVFRYTFSGIVDFVEFGNPLNSHFETYIGKRFYGVVHIDARSAYFDEELGFYLIADLSEDNYIEYFLEDMYFRAFIHSFFTLTKTNFSLWTGDWYDIETIQFPAYLDRTSVTLDAAYVEISYDGETGDASWNLMFHEPDRPYYDEIYGGGPIDEVAELEGI
jgi:hypothetical protein